MAGDKIFIGSYPQGTPTIDTQFLGVEAGAVILPKASAILSLVRFGAGAKIATTDVTVTTATDTLLNWQTEEFDFGNVWDAGQPSRFTAPVTGVYSAVTNVVFASNATGFRYVRIVKNGSVILSEDRRSPVSGTTTHVAVPWVGPLTAADYLQTFVYQSSGGNLAVVHTERVAMALVCLARG